LGAKPTTFVLARDISSVTTSP